METDQFYKRDYGQIKERQLDKDKANYVSLIDQAFKQTRKQAIKNLKKVRGHLLKDPSYFDNEWRNLKVFAELEAKNKGPETIEQIRSL